MATIAQGRAPSGEAESVADVNGVTSPRADNNTGIIIGVAANVDNDAKGEKGHEANQTIVVGKALENDGQAGNSGNENAGKAASSCSRQIKILALCAGVLILIGASVGIALLALGGKSDGHKGVTTSDAQKGAKPSDQSVTQPQSPPRGGYQGRRRHDGRHGGGWGGGADGGRRRGSGH
eukprot:TRINITY_DN78204_c0_g1_i1.p1 TRINITY_DN78204_c0_g1~~TRINITY_DN78204_c0_g1_i1.p1  ORF type:complete len:202 (-),score=12.77 TRINITY_DN78204_c0_g1_i1:144-680(-)